MKPVTPRGVGLPMDEFEAVVFARNQPQYLPLPALVDREGVVVTEWEPDPDELARLCSGGKIRLYVHTFSKPLPPLKVEVL